MEVCKSLHQVPLSLRERDGVRGAAPGPSIALFPRMELRRRRKREISEAASRGDSPHPGPLPKGEGDRLRPPPGNVNRMSPGNVNNVRPKKVLKWQNR